MKFIHISDLHIGKRVNEFPLLEDQKYVLSQVLAIADEEQAEGVLIAGDIYDKPVPSAEAVQLFDWFLTRLAELGKQVFAVSGNHDSPERIAFGARLMKSRGVYLSQVYDGNVIHITAEDAYGELDIYLLPFVKPALVRHVLEAEGAEELPESYHDAVRLAVERMKVDRTKRNILVAHQFVTGAARCESEEVAVGGLDNVDGAVFDDFDYVALGHIHSPQCVGRDTVRYCGTPLKYSFSEAGHTKSVTILELKEKGSITINTVPLQPKRDMKKIKGTYMEVTGRPFYESLNREDYFHITLTDEEDIPDAVSRLRVIYPNLMKLEYDNKRTRSSRDLVLADRTETESPETLFAEFYKKQNNQEMSIWQQEFTAKLIKEIWEEDA